MANESSVLVRLRLLGGQAFSRGAQQAGRGLGSIGREGTNVSRGLSGVNKAIGVTAAAMRGLATGGAIAVGAGLAYGVKASAGFEQSMANVQARLLTTKGNMKLLEGQALDLGARTQFSARQASDAMGEFAAAGFNTRQIMGLMPGTLNLAAASGEDLASTAELQGAMMRQFGLHASDAGHVADVLTTAVNKSAIGMDDLGLTMKYVGPVAGRFGQSIEDIGGAAAILGNVGIKGETAGTTLRRAFVNLVKPSGKTMDMLAGMGITTGEFSKATTDAKGNLRAFPQILGNLAGHMEDLTKPQQRRALAQLFGVEALPGMLTLFGKGQKGIERMSASLRNSGGAAARTAGIMRNTVQGSWDNFTGSVETAAIKLTKRFNPAIRGALDQAAGGVNKLTGLASAFGAGLGGGGAAKPTREGGRQGGGGAARTVQAAPTGAAAAGQAVRAKLEPVFNWITEQGPKIGAALAGAGRDLLNAFAPAMPFITNVVLPVLQGIAQGILGGVVTAFKIAVPVIKIIATALGWIGNAAKPLRPVLVGIGTVIGFVAGGPILGLLGKLKYLGVIFRILAVPIRVATGLFRGVVGVVGRLFGAFGRVLTGVQRFVGTFTSMPARVLRAALNVVGSVVRTISQLPGKLVSLARRAGGNFISGIANGVRAKLAGLTGFMGRVGKTIIDTVTNAIKGAPAVIANALLSIVPGGKVRDAVAGFLGLQTGGHVRQGGWAVVGERGPELAHLPSGSTVYDSSQTRRARAAMAGPAPIMLTANLHLSGRQIHSEVFRVDQQLSEAT
jgi:TP901 family phage tail tape measure protein